MTKTERLYYTDCYLREFEARVLRSEPAPNGFKIYLDRTAFYPTSGGQPTDSGTIAGIQVLEAVDEGDEIGHVLPQAPEAEGVSGKAVIGQAEVGFDRERRIAHILIIGKPFGDWPGLDRRLFRRTIKIFPFSPPK